MVHEHDAHLLIGQRKRRVRKARDCPRIHLYTGAVEKAVDDPLMSASGRKCDEVRTGQVACAYQCFCRKGMRAGYDGNEVGTPDRLDLDQWMVGQSECNQRFSASCRQVILDLVDRQHVEEELDTRNFLRELPQGLGYQCACHACGRSGAEYGCFTPNDTLDLCAETRELAQYGVDLGIDLECFRCRDQPVAVPGEKGNAKEVFDPPDRTAERRLRHVENLGRTGDRAGLHHRVEDLDLAKAEDLFGRGLARVAYIVMHRDRPFQGMRGSVCEPALPPFAAAGVRAPGLCLLHHLSIHGIYLAGPVPAMARFGCQSIYENVSS